MTISTLKNKHFLVIVITAIITISICSKSSPLYPLNDWVDANCFLTVGKSMLHGKVPYRDLYEQKGPLLYMIHAAAALISDTSFLGVYFIEMIACAFFLFFSFRIMRLFFPSVNIMWIPLFSALIYSSACFCHGDSAEELCMPLFAFAIFSGLKMLQNNQPLSFGEGIAIGITSASVLWIKFSMLGFYLGWICVPAILLIQQRKIKSFFRMLGQILFGVFVISFPVLIYFAKNNALTDLWTVYFYNNLFLYSTASGSTMSASVFLNLFEGCKNILKYNLISAILIVIGIICLAVKVNKRILWFYITSLAGTFLLVYIGGRHIKYYSLIFSSFAPIGMMEVSSIFQVFAKKYLPSVPFSPQKNRIFKISVYLLSTVLAFLLCENTYLLSYEKSDMPQYRFAEIIQSVDNATLLNYGFLDGGFYTTTGIVPTCRHFCATTIPLDEIMETQNEAVNSGSVDFVVTRQSQLESERYRCVANATFYLEGMNWDYYLYQLIP